jgi:hypothetical protein
MGIPVKRLEHAAMATLQADFNKECLKYERKGKFMPEQKLVARILPFPEVDTSFIAKSPALLMVFLGDFRIHKKDLLHELAVLCSVHGLAIDHQWKVANKLKMSSTTEVIGTQSLRISEDFGLILNYCIAPNAADQWIECAMNEIVDRHDKKPPGVIYVDINCYSKK